MKLSIDFERWTTTKAAVAAALALGGVVGSAVAFSPTISAPIKWAGGAEFVIGAGTGFFKVYTVPAGRNLLLTDLVASNFAGTASNFAVYSGPGDSCDIGTLVNRFNVTVVPPGNNTVLAFQTGIGFSAGQAVCIGTSASLSFSGRGFLFTAAPAS